MRSQFFLFLITFTTFANSCIVEHSHFITVNDYLTPQDFNKYTVVILDIDNTIAQPNAIIGSEEWFAHMMNKVMEDDCDVRAAVNRILPLYFEIMHTVDFGPVEQMTIDIIRQLQEAGLIVIGLTARSLEIKDRTIKQLNTIGIDFTRSSIWHEDFEYDCCVPYAYKEGVIFCAGADKGKILMHVFDRLNYCPCKIIAIDDKAKHLQAIARAINPCIDFIGIRYGHLDDKVRNFDGVAADEELLEWIIWNWLFSNPM